ncbi:bcl-2-like protein 11 [Hyperolius riggenbachi]|uniref:bcl-2-like protein 11 n=1 Tax=Hyperolius riggenbachi TaxID=752182 RepID=UPI0035A290AF
MAKQPQVLNPECSGGDDQIKANRRTPHRPLRRGAPTSLVSPFQVHHSDEGGSSSASTPWGPGRSPYSPNSFANRSPHDILVRRSSLVSKTSSGYFSFDVSPAPQYCDKATQTPSLPCQAFNHYLSVMAARNLNDIVDLRPEIWIARELRRIGDEFDAIYNPRRGILDNRRRGVDNDQVIILRVLRYIIRLIWRMQ